MPASSATFTLLDGRLTLTDAHPRPAEDPLWLAAAIPPFPPGSHVLDAGCGCGVLGLAFQVYRPGHRLSFLDASPAATALTRANLALNRQAGEVFQGNLLSHTPATPYDVILSNPPFHLTSRGHTTADTTKALAHGITPAGLKAWLRACLSLTTPTGQVHLVTHTATLPLLLPLCGACKAVVTPLATHATRPPKRALLMLFKQGPATVIQAPAIPVHSPVLRTAVLTRATPLPIAPDSTPNRHDSTP